jgi:hypothetical protein
MIINKIHLLTSFLLLSFSFNSFALLQYEEKTPLWAFIEITDDNAYKIEPGREVTIQFEGAGKCVVEVSRIENKLALIDISDCDTVIEIQALIPKRGHLKKSYSQIWYRPITEQEKAHFPLDRDSPLIVARLPVDSRIKVLGKTNYKQVYNQKFQHWFKIKTPRVIGWVPEEDLVFEKGNEIAKTERKIKMLKVKLINVKRKDKFSPGIFGFGKYKLSISSFDEKQDGTKVSFDHTSLLTLGGEGGIITEKKKIYYGAFAYFSLNGSNHDVSVPFTYNVGGSIGKILDSGFVPQLGLEFESFISYNLDDLSAGTTTTKDIRKNSLLWASLIIEKKIFSLKQVAKAFGLDKIPYSKTFFRIIDQSFYLKLSASYPVLRQSENLNAFKGTKFQIEASSRLFRDIDLAAYIDFINLKSDSEVSGQRFGVSIGFAFY